MSAKYTIIQRPPVWVSAHRKCEFVYSITGTVISSGYDDGSGYLKVNLGGAMAYTLAVGDRVYISAAPYKGYHVVKTVHSSVQYTFETEYTSAGTGFIFPVVLPTISLYKGYAASELSLPLYPSGSLDLNTIQPRELVAEFQPEFGIDGKITFDISGYLKSVMETPYVGGYNETEQSHQYRKSATVDYLPMNYAKVDVMLLEQGGTTANLECTIYAANTALTHAELNAGYVDTGRPLSTLQTPPQFTNGVNHYDVITGLQINRIKA